MLSVASDIAVWLSPRLDEIDVREIVPLLGDDERARWHNLRIQGDRERFLTGRLLARYALSHAVRNTVDVFDWRFGSLPNGKTVVAGPHPGLEMNIAHSADMIVVAITKNHPIGVDIERIDGGGGCDPVLSVLSRNDRWKLRGCRQDEVGYEFLKLWTMKEACAKRTGEGVGMDFAALDLDWQPGLNTQTLATSSCALNVRTVATLRGTYSVAVAWQASGNRVSEPLIKFANLKTTVRSTAEKFGYI